MPWRLNSWQSRKFHKFRCYIGTLGYNTPMNAKRLLYLTHVRSVLQYCTQVWSLYSKKDIVYVESVQRQATLFMTNYWELSFVDRLMETNLLPLLYMREIMDVLLFYNIIQRRIGVDIDRYYLVMTSMGGEVFIQHC